MLNYHYTIPSIKCLQPSQTARQAMDQLWTKMPSMVWRRPLPGRLLTMPMQILTTQVEPGVPKFMRLENALHIDLYWMINACMHVFVKRCTHWPTLSRPSRPSQSLCNPCCRNRAKSDPLFESWKRSMPIVIPPVSALYWNLRSPHAVISVCWCINTWLFHSFFLILYNIQSQYQERQPFADRLEDDGRGVWQMFKSDGSSSVEWFWQGVICLYSVVWHVAVYMIH